MPDTRRRPASSRLADPVSSSLLVKQLRLSRRLRAIDFFSFRGNRPAARRVAWAFDTCGFAFCLPGLQSEPALVGGLAWPANADVFCARAGLGDRHGAW